MVSVTHKSPYLLFLCVCLSSCSQLPGKLRIIEGSFYHSREQYNKAVVSFQKALVYEEAAPYANYGLGVAYLAMGEEEAAMKRFAAAEILSSGEEHRELRYRTHYNLGVIRFEQGDYAAAAGEFRRALESDGSHIEAKRNLELSLLSMESRGEASIREHKNNGREHDILFDYLRQKEQDRWRSREWAEEETASGPDY